MPSIQCPPAVSGLRWKESVNPLPSIVLQTYTCKNHFFPKTIQGSEYNLINSSHFILATKYMGWKKQQYSQCRLGRQLPSVPVVSTCETCSLRPLHFFYSGNLIYHHLTHPSQFLTHSYSDTLNTEITFSNHKFSFLFHHSFPPIDPILFRTSRTSPWKYNKMFVAKNSSFPPIFSPSSL